MKQNELKFNKSPNRIEFSRKILVTTVFLTSLLTLLILLDGCKKKDRGILMVDNNQIVEQVQPIIQNFFNAQYDYLTGKSTVPSWKVYQKTPEDDSLMLKLDRLKSTLESMDHSYIGYTSEIRVSVIAKQLNSVDLKIVDDYTLTNSDLDNQTGMPIITQGMFSYLARIELVNSEWKISEFSTTGMDPWYIDLSVESVPASSLVFRDAETANSVAKFSYDAGKAVQYAYKYYKKPNNQYCNYDNGGGDCTNFLSQCLQAGGWTQISSWRTSGARCCSNKIACLTENCYTCSWTVANNFYKWVQNSGRIDKACYLDADLRVGDIMQFDFGNNGVIEHSSIVTRKEKSGKSTKVYVTYRSSGGEETAQKDRLSNAIPGTHFGWRVKSKSN